METVTNKWQLCCRLCAAYDYENNKNILEDVQLVQTIKEYFRIQVHPRDMLPKVICSSCQYFINDVMKFHKRINGVQEMFNEPIIKTIPKGIINDASNIEKEGEVTGVNMGEELAASHSSYATTMKADVMSISYFPNTLEKSPLQIKGESELGSVHKSSSDFIELSSNNKTDNGKQVNINGSKQDQDALLEDVQLDMTCPHCERNFNSFHPYSNHIKYQHTEKVQLNVWQCPLCCRLFRSIGSLRYHLQSKHVKSELLANCPSGPDLQIELSCQECHQKFGTFLAYRKHMNLKHTKRTLRKCPICCKDFCNNANLKLHLIQKHMNVQMKTLNKSSKDLCIPLTCTVCCERVKSFFAYRTHMKGMHMHVVRNENWKCPICGIDNRGSFKLKMHIKDHLSK